MIRALARRQSNPCFWPLPLQQLAELEALLPPGPSVHLAGERPRRHAFGAASPLHLSGVAISLRGGGQQESTLRVAEPGVGLGENKKEIYLRQAGSRCPATPL